ncbi:DJ-1 family protein [Mycoplasma wenyonii]|uniref:DJ-1 family protein n=1 Tax=Mycoplasma wenyonii TaxID=65123 RepID=A0A328PTW2_9MOLU|nr:DJ-1/PfpI family protein [Mycoplasma wenyonii]RAO95190.1 DJ-1 family protein [Mycoplasma wenyonii]
MKPSRIVRIGIIVANNIEDMEFIIPFDIWRRAKFMVETISCEVKNIASLNYTDIKFTTNCKLKHTNLEHYDLLFFPGGPGHTTYFSPPSTAKEFGASKLNTAVRKFYKDDNKWLVAICAAPSYVMSVIEKDWEPDVKFTCYKDPRFIGDYDKLWVDTPVYVDLKKKFITAQAAACSLQLAFLVVELFSGKEEAERLAKSMLYDYVSPLNSETTV